MAKNEKTTCCSFCGKTQDQVRKLIVGPNNVRICDECIGLCEDILREEMYDEDWERDESTEDIRLVKPMEMKAFLDEYVIGQDEAKKTLAVAVYNHYKRVLAKKNLVCPPGILKRVNLYSDSSLSFFPFLISYS